ncbi:unnamed protein product [Peniophora sp. CBMAI 1063]|nr:unnamed protein product [Peniophora sp. CBMAI 1063]
MLEMLELSAETLPEEVPEAREGDLTWELANHRYITEGAEFRRRDWSEMGGIVAEEAYNKFMTLLWDDENDRSWTIEEVMPYIRHGENGLQGVLNLLECFIEHLEWFDDDVFFPYAVGLEGIVVALDGHAPWPAGTHLRYFIDKDTEDLPASSVVSSPETQLRDLSPDRNMPLPPLSPQPTSPHISHGSCIHLAHRMQGTLSLQAVCNCQLLITLEPSPAAPTLAELGQNIDACFEPIAAILKELLTFSVIHAILMFDEIALELRLRYGDKTNQFLGLCREHVEGGGREFLNEDDLHLLFEDVVEERVHFASKVRPSSARVGLVLMNFKATVGAIGLLTSEPKLYTVLETTLLAVKLRPALQRVRFISIDTDGEARWGAALVLMTFKGLLAHSSPLFELLSLLKLMDFHVGPDDITINKDPKHVCFKWPRHPSSIIHHHLLDAGHTLTHVRSALNPADKQDVERAYGLEHDLWSLPPAPPKRGSTYKEVREALHLLGDVCLHLVMPFICIDLSLSEQLEHLSSAAHLVLALYVHENAKSHFFPHPLVIDIMLMVKNTYFCVAKAKVDMPTAPFYLILLGTDRLETLFGIVWTMVSNDVNVDVLQLALRATGATDVANILACYPEYYREPRRAHAPAINRDMQAVNGADKITLRDWCGEVHVETVTLLTAWRRGRDTVECKYPKIKDVLQVNVPSVPEDSELDDAEEGPVNEDMDGEVSMATRGEGFCELEDAAADACGVFLKTVLYQGKTMNKSRALAQHFKMFKIGLSCEHLDCVQGKLRYGKLRNDSSPEAAAAGPALAISNLVVSLLCVADDGRLFLVLGEVNQIQINSKSVDHVPLSLLPEKSVRISYQALGLVPITADDDPSLKYSWRATSLLSIYGTALPGALILPIDPEISTHSPGNAFYVLDDETLISLAATLYEQVHPSHGRHISTISVQDGFPYREHTGTSACFAVTVGGNLPTQ